MKKLEEVGFFIDPSWELWKKRIESLKQLIAREYLYPSYAIVELSENLFHLITEAKEIFYDEDTRKLIIDGIHYIWHVKDEVILDYYTLDEENAEEIKEVYEQNAKELMYYFDDNQNMLIALLTNSNDDFELVALFEFIIVT